jgi:hypothetical protein
MTVRGIVKGQVVILGETARLPDGAEVEVRLTTPADHGEEAFRRILEHRTIYAGRPIEIDAVLEEDKREREERTATWLSRQP